MRFVTLVNRTSNPLVGTWDGRVFTIPPGKSSYPEIQALKFKLQNPRMGTADPNSNRPDFDTEYLCGIEEFNDPISPVEQTNSIELFNRGKVGGPATEVVRPRGGAFVRSNDPLPQDGQGFVKP